MDAFEQIFGLPARELHPNCVFLPVASRVMLRAFNAGEPARGKLYRTWNGEDFTLIRTGVGAPFAGDAVLHLVNSPCRNLFLFGSCGLIQPAAGVSIGSLVSPSTAYALESFTGLIENDLTPRGPYRPDAGLHSRLMNTDLTGSVHDATCLSLGSLKLQEEKFFHFTKTGATIVDMESAAFFAAARHAGLPALALMYVSDVVGTAPFFQSPTVTEKEAIQQSIRQGIELLCTFILKYRKD